MTLEAQLLETWAINGRINRYVLDAISADALVGVGPAEGRSVGAMFAHLHNTRLLWLKAAAPDLLVGLSKLEAPAAADPATLSAALDASAGAIGELLERGLATGRVKGFKPHPVAFLGYLLAHDAHHRGEVQLTLTQIGCKLNDKVGYGMWEWSAR
jgi:uncharacterized damage-inducible protein DinB